MEKLTKLELIKTAVEEWYSDELDEHQALVNIATVLGSSEPTKECMEWAKGRIGQSFKVHDDWLYKE